MRICMFHHEYLVHDSSTVECCTVTFRGAICRVHSGFISAECERRKNVEGSRKKYTVSSSQLLYYVHSYASFYD